MASRPAAAAFSCLQCRAAILRAVSSTSLPALRVPAITTRPTRYALPIRTFATTSQQPAPPPTESDPQASPAFGTKEEKEHRDDMQGAKARLQEEPVTQEEESKPVADNEAGSDTPWYLDVELPEPTTTQHIAPLPEVPEGSPALLEPLLKYAYEEMGLDEMELLDLRDMEPPPALGPNLLMLFGTARSERHLHVSASRMVKWLRYHYRIDSRADGLIGPGELKTKLRRLRKKAKLLGSSAVPTGEDDGISTGWICVNLGTIGSSTGEAARFDDDGRMTGFGASPTGTTIVVQVMTEARRKELNLEKLWSGQLKRSIEAEEALKVNEDEFLRKFGKKPAPVPRPRKLQRAPNPRGFSQKRSFSTSRAVASVDISTTFVRAPTESAQDVLEEALLCGKQVHADQIVPLLQRLLTPLRGHIDAKDVERAYSLLQMAYHRGIPVLRTDVIVTLISGLTLQSSRRSDYARVAIPRLQTVLKRAELPCPTEQQLQQLMTAYIIRGWLTYFWDTWHIPPLHRQSRSPALYAYVLNLAVKSQRKSFCADVLRRLYPEMPNEVPPVQPVGAVWDALQSCILIADPGAKELAAKSARLKNAFVSPRYNSEFVRMYRNASALKADATR